MLRIITQGDLWFLLGVILILVWLGKTYASDRQKLAGGFVAIIAFLGFVGYAFDHFPPRNAEELFHIAVRALVTFSLTLGFAWIVLALLGGITLPIREGMRRARVNAQRRKRVAEQERLRIPAKRPPVPPPAPVPPPPTREELLTAAHDRYEKTLQLLTHAGLDETELHAARERAKQQYLRELDQVMK